MSSSLTLTTGLTGGISNQIDIASIIPPVTKKELLSKRGLKSSERQAILTLLKRFRLIRIDRRVTDEYSRLRSRYPSLAKGDALIAASALARKLPLLTQKFASLSRDSRISLVAGRSQKLAVARAPLTRALKPISTFTE